MCLLCDVPAQGQRGLTALVGVVGGVRKLDADGEPRGVARTAELGERTGRQAAGGVVVGGDEVVQRLVPVREVARVGPRGPPVEAGGGRGASRVGPLLDVELDLAARKAR